MAGGVLNIVGVDEDPPAACPLMKRASSPSLDNEALALLLGIGRKSTIKKAAVASDLQLSGHTHRGQIFPFRFFTGMVYPLQDGLHDLGELSCMPLAAPAPWGPHPGALASRSDHRCASQKRR